MIASRLHSIETAESQILDMLKLLSSKVETCEKKLAELDQRQTQILYREIDILNEVRKPPHAR